MKLGELMSNESNLAELQSELTVASSTEAPLRFRYQKPPSHLEVGCFEGRLQMEPGFLRSICSKVSGLRTPWSVQMGTPSWSTCVADNSVLQTRWVINRRFLWLLLTEAPGQEAPFREGLLVGTVTWQHRASGRKRMHGTISSGLYSSKVGARHDGSIG